MQPVETKSSKAKPNRARILKMKVYLQISSSRLGKWHELADNPMGVAMEYGPTFKSNLLDLVERHGRAVQGHLPVDI